MSLRRLAVASLACALMACRQAPSEATETPAPTPHATETPAPTSHATETPAGSPTPTTAAAATSTSTPSAIPSPASTSPLPPPARSALAREPGGASPLSAAAETVVDPAATFEIEIAARLHDARLVLLDAADAQVAARDVREVGATTRLTLAPETPLAPGARYLLRVDGASRREMHDADGRAFAPLVFPLLAAGTPAPPETRKVTRRRRR